MGQQLALDRAGAFGPHQVYGPRPRPGHQGQKQHQHTHAAHPLGQRPPEEDPPWHGLHIRQDGGSGGGEARGRLEQGIRIVGDSPAEDVRHRPEQAQHDPRHGHHRIAVPTLQTVLPGRDVGEDQPAQAAQPQRPQKRLPAGLTIAYGHQQRQQQAPGFHPEGIIRNSRIANGHKYSNYIPPDCPCQVQPDAPSGEGRGLRGTKIFAQKTSPQEGRTTGPHGMKSHVPWKNLTISAELYTLS